MDKDINRELAEDAAEDCSTDVTSRKWFVLGWLDFCDGKEPDPGVLKAWQYKYALDGYIAARDAPE